MDPQSANYTPLDTEKLSAKKRSFNIPSKVLIGLILFFTVGVGVVGYLLTQEQFKTQVPAQVEPTTMVFPSLSPTQPQTSPTEAAQAQTSTDSANLAQVSTISPTETETPTPEPSVAETLSPTPTERAIGGYNDPSPTPTEIILAGATSTPSESGNATDAPQPSEIPSAGVATYAGIFAVLSITIIFLGFIL